MISLRKLMGKLHLYTYDVVYYIPLKEIKVPAAFKKSWIGAKKWNHKKKYYKRNGTFESQIILDKDFVLMDGYSSYKLAQAYHVTKVPVIFKKHQNENGGF